MANNERQAWTELFENRQQRFSSIVPAHKAAETEAALREFIKETPIPVLTDVVKPGKYRNVKTGGYASRKEAKRAAELQSLARMMLVTNLREQVKYLLVPKQPGERACYYVADFVYDEQHEITREWQTVVEDCKGMRTPLYVLKRKLMQMVHKVVIKET